MLRRRDSSLRLLFTFVFVLLGLAQLHAQPSRSGAEDDEDGGFVIRDSDVGYIDSAIIGDSIRLRFDTAYGSNRPNRAEFFYAPSQPVGPGLPLPEVSLDYQDFQLYLERQANDFVSLFVELGVRGLNPVVNENSTGLGDVNAGFKCALLESESGMLTGQFRVYAPTGDVDRGLGTGHASFEPGILMFQRLNRQWTASGEVRYWTTSGGSAFAGQLIRYGLGLQYDPGACCPIEPVAELVGWTVLDGRESALATPGGIQTIEDAKGDTILNAKLGARLFLTPGTDLYIGYGRTLTGDRWYEDTLRAELRYAY